MFFNTPFRTPKKSSPSVPYRGWPFPTVINAERMVLTNESIRELYKLHVVTRRQEKRSVETKKAV